MSQEVQHAELKKETQQLLQGPLQHVRAAALAAALVPLASLVATPASAQTVCQAARTVCGFVWNDNGDGIQQPGEPGIDLVKVVLTTPTDTMETETSGGGFFYFQVDEGTPYTITVKIPTGYEASPFHATPDTT